MESHGGAGDGEEMKKAVIPYGAIQKVFNDVGGDSGHVFTYEDFADALLGGANSLGFPHDQFLRAVKEWGSESGALKALGLTQVPLAGREAYEELRTSWERKGLNTALQVLESYQLNDIEPLLRICLRRHAFVMGQAGVSSYLDHPSLSSQAFNEMLRSAMHGTNPMTLYPLGPFLTRLIRSQICGGASWVNHRKIQVGDVIPPQRMSPHYEDGLRSDEMEKVVSIVTIDCKLEYASHFH